MGVITSFSEDRWYFSVEFYEECNAEELVKVYNKRAIRRRSCHGVSSVQKTSSY